MKHIYILLLCVFLGACKESNSNKEIEGGKSNSRSESHKNLDEKHDDEEEEHHDEPLFLTSEQLKILDIDTGKIPVRNMNGFIKVNGKISVPPQNEAVITTSIGANIVSIEVIEGQQVKKGDVLAYISHPDLIQLQTDYLKMYNQLSFLEQDFLRQEKLYNAKVGSGRDYQQAKANYNSAKGLVKGLEGQLLLLGLNASYINKGEIYTKAPLKSTIDGFIEKVGVKTGQFVQPQKELFEIVNTDHIHADLMVFEKDISKVKNGQKVKFLIKSVGNKEFEGHIISVGKSIEDGPKAMHVHAEIDGHFDNLILGMYVNARIIFKEKKEQALPLEAFFRDGDRLFVFSVSKETEKGVEFEPLEVLEKENVHGYISFIFKKKQNDTIAVAKSGAYYLMSELKKSEAEHHH